MNLDIVEAHAPMGASLNVLNLPVNEMYGAVLDVKYYPWVGTKDKKS